jgi:hypothetical protein
LKHISRISHKGLQREGKLIEMGDAATGVPVGQGGTSSSSSFLLEEEESSLSVSTEFRRVVEINLRFLVALGASLMSLCRQFWRMIGSISKELWARTVSLASAIIVQGRAMYDILRRRAMELLERLICMSCVRWMHEKTGLSTTVSVGIMGLFLAAAVAALWTYRNRRHRNRRKRRNIERSMSLDLSLSNSGRGARDRGFSLDSSISQGKGNRSRGLSLDFWNAGKHKGGSHHNHQNRERSSSLDLLTEQLFVDEGNANPLLLRPTGAIVPGGGVPGVGKGRGLSTISQARSRIPTVSYYGPTETKLVYSTWTPPPSWTEASRSLLPTDVRMKLQREVCLDLSKDDPILTMKEPNSRATPFALSVSQCSVHVKTPVIGGVLEIYVKESSKEEWMEHTFDSARNAAQFQLDLLAIQILGPTLYRMYQALELIHQGSMACEGREYVCHHDEMSDDVPQGLGVAWDDVMRALGSNLPSIRMALERLWWHHHNISIPRIRTTRVQTKELQEKHHRRSSTTATKVNAAENAGSSGAQAADPAKATAVNSKNDNIKTQKNDYIHLTMDYVRKRLLIGPVDFFRLFVPCLPDTALPRNDSSKRRMEQLLTWRKRTARASLLVQGYVKARILVNKGWALGRNLPTRYLSRRLAYDDNVDNSQRDASAKNEYYEATVSRDILTFVRPNEPNAFAQDVGWLGSFRTRSLRTAISRYQAFTLVGHHIFKIPQDEDFPLVPQNDPVLSIPSLRELIEANSDLDFFVTALFPEASKVVFITCYVRSLPPGIDSAFDKNVSEGQFCLM